MAFYREDIFLDNKEIGSIAHQVDKSRIERVPPYEESPGDVTMARKTILDDLDISEYRIYIYLLKIEQDLPRDSAGNKTAIIKS